MVRACPWWRSPVISLPVLNIKGILLNIGRHRLQGSSADQQRGGVFHLLNQWPLLFHRRPVVQSWTSPALLQTDQPKSRVAQGRVVRSFVCLCVSFPLPHTRTFTQQHATCCWHGIHIKAEEFHETQPGVHLGGPHPITQHGVNPGPDLLSSDFSLFSQLMFTGPAAGVQPPFSPSSCVKLRQRSHLLGPGQSHTSAC